VRSTHFLKIISSFLSGHFLLKNCSLSISLSMHNLEVHQWQYPNLYITDIFPCMPLHNPFVLPITPFLNHVKPLLTFPLLCIA